MRRFRVLTTAAYQGVLTSVEAQARAAPIPPDFVGSDIAQYVPSSWDGQGPVPTGWSLAHGLIFEPGGSRVAIVAFADWAAGKSEFNAALDELPGDWSVLP